MKQNNGIINILIIFLTGVCVCVIFTGPILLLLKQWSIVGTWRYIIVPIAIWMLWNEYRKEYTHKKKLPKYLWTFLLISTFLLTFFAYITCLPIFSELAISSFIIFSVVFFGGYSWIRIVIWPLGYCIFMITIAARILPQLAPYLQYISAVIVDYILNLIGLSSLRDGLTLRLPATVLRVGYWCSGANQLTSLLAVAIPLAYIRHRCWWKQIILIFSAIPLGLFFNAFRILLIALWNYSTARASIHGPKDVLLIPIIHPAAIAGLVGISFLLKSDRGSEKRSKRFNFSRIVSVVLEKRSNQIQMICLMAFLLLVIFRMVVSFNKVDNKQIMNYRFNNGIIEYKKIKNNKIPNILSVTTFDTCIVSTYANNSDTVHIVSYYLSKQLPARSLLLNKLEMQKNWENRKRMIINEKTGCQMIASTVTDEHDKPVYDVLFWYDIDHHIVSDAFQFALQKIILYFSRGHTNGNLVMVVSPYKKGHMERLVKFVECIEINHNGGCYEN